MVPFKINYLLGWLEGRYPVEEVTAFFKKKVVPIHKYSFWYYFGGMTLFLLGIQIMTGILLMLYYRPTAEHAFESVQFIMTRVHFGWLIRSIHSWSANLLIFFAFVHMFSAYLLKAYRSPREITWIMGVFLFFLLLGFGFTGYLLPWNTLSFFATKVGTDIPGVIPFIGKYILQFLRGGEDVTTATLTRLFGMHVAVLPILTLVVLGLHLTFIQVQGMSYPPHVTIKREISFFPDFLLHDAVGWLCSFALLLILATIYPWELGVKADPFAATPEGIRPEWYFLFMFQTLKIVPPRLLLFDGEVVAIMTFLLVGIIWIIIPFIDRKSQRGQRSSLFSGLGIAGIIYITIMTISAFLF